MLFLCMQQVCAFAMLLDNSVSLWGAPVPIERVAILWFFHTLLVVISHPHWFVLSLLVPLICLALFVYCVLFVSDFDLLL